MKGESQLKYYFVSDFFFQKGRGRKGGWGKRKGGGKKRENHFSAADLRPTLVASKTKVTKGKGRKKRGGKEVNVTFERYPFTFLFLL